MGRPIGSRDAVNAPSRLPRRGVRGVDVFALAHNVAPRNKTGLLLTAARIASPE